ncbi:ubiquinone anaerobic biosynthesis protein UbiV [Brevundimonas sp.]|uniref:ubiquinone anaerobic biosynthesis protein UbiV n=1 Tax=Brevundimonas sp. TaxID=1871086 RepID=UPI002D4F15E5|nr:U32 family peptidase [Brevundimonas sp.]HYD27055.1 U32 family peptidase [Brevundimonas sp.]
MTDPIQLTLGPLLFNWAPDRIRDFYARVADEAPVDRVYLGEVVCGKRAPLLDAALADAAERLTHAGKTVVWSTLGLPALRRDRKSIAVLAAEQEMLIEINDISALRGRTGPFVAGPLLNVYNEGAARELMARGCVRLCANVELSLDAVSAVAAACPGLEIELFAFGRLPLALSGRCYHARHHGLHKDACQFICDRDPDGLALKTLDGRDFLAVNGVQTLSHGVQLVDAGPATLKAAGVTALRLSPHTADMVAVASALRDRADGRIDAAELAARIVASGPPGALVGGYLRGDAGLRPVGAPS